jgi:muramoyltetrapeptide carboxypeptidase
MPATALWNDAAENADITALFNNIAQWHQGSTSGSIPLLPISTVTTAPIEGTLFGGCFTVLTNLIGTPYFPESLADTIIFIEDTDEHPARLMRALNQWLQSGVLVGARAMIIGHLRNLGSQIPDCADFVLRQIAERVSIPVFHSPLFGHTSPNYPLMIGAKATIRDSRLTWRIDRTLLTTGQLKGAPT